LAGINFFGEGWSVVVIIVELHIRILVFSILHRCYPMDSIKQALVSNPGAPIQ
jgi:hypothetical protein